MLCFHHGNEQKQKQTHQTAARLAPRAIASFYFTLSLSPWPNLKHFLTNKLFRYLAIKSVHFD